VAAAGFLPWNWSPARIFLGDVGSIFLGFILASLGVLSSQRGDLPAPAWVVLLGVFVVDATLTLVRRFARASAGSPRTGATPTSAPCRPDFRTRR
jgi:Fuc2NAc and GlcNAc transferase